MVRQLSAKQLFSGSNPLAALVFNIATKDKTAIQRFESVCRLAIFIDKFGQVVEWHTRRT